MGLFDLIFGEKKLMMTSYECQNSKEAKEEYKRIRKQLHTETEEDVELEAAALSISDDTPLELDISDDTPFERRINVLKGLSQNGLKLEYWGNLVRIVKKELEEKQKILEKEKLKAHKEKLKEDKRRKKRMRFDEEEYEKIVSRIKNNPEFKKIIENFAKMCMDYRIGDSQTEERMEIPLEEQTADQMIEHEKQRWKYKKQWAEQLGKQEREQEEKLTKLNRLLLKKGLYINNSRHLTRIINDEEGEQRYQRFKKQMLHNQPKKISDYLRNYIKLNSECEDYLLRLLDEMKVKLPEDFNLTNKLLRIEDELDLETFEKKLHTHAKNKPDFEQMGGFEFQDFLKELFKKMGYNTQPTKKTGDQGADLIIERFGQTWIVQAKNYNESIVDNSAIQEAVGAIKYYKADNAIVVTTSTFTKSAKELANANDVKLINGHGLDDLVKKYW